MDEHVTSVVPFNSNATTSSDTPGCSQPFQLKVSIVSVTFYHMPALLVIGMAVSVRPLVCHIVYNFNTRRSTVTQFPPNGSPDSSSCQCKAVAEKNEVCGTAIDTIFYR